jgi:enoyl-CoA hydratase
LTVKAVTVIGSGLMGRGIAYASVVGGYETVLHDVSAQALAARAMADRVLALGPLAVRLAKAALNASSQMPLSAGPVFESTAQAITFESKDKLEGTSAFLDKRKPAFTGE